MRFKIFKCLLQTGCDFPHLGMSRQISLKLLQSRSCIRSFSEESGSEDNPVKDIKKLLGKSSPLKPSPEVESFWATSPYAEGTVFDGEDGEEETTCDPSTILMFPGQGNQFVGMADKIIKYGVVQDMFDEASEILGYNLLKICTKGPIEKLSKTEYCQPATLVCSLGAVEKLKEEKPWVIDQCRVLCGYSLGEFAALALAGCLTFERVVKLIKVRAEIMSECCKMAKGGMMTVRFVPSSLLTEAITDAIAHCSQQGIENPVCATAVYLYPNCKVLGGHMTALKYISENLKKYRLRKVSVLPVEGAFHTSLMKTAEDLFKEAISSVTFNKPLVNVYANVTGKVYHNSNQIKNILPKHISSPVKWEQITNSINQRFSDQKSFVYEVGPGKSLSSIFVRVFPSFCQRTMSVTL